MEYFYTLQGEGFHSGKAAYFIRLGGCDVGCVWCDVKESWDADVHPRYTVEQMVKDAAAFPGRMAVITGGEPLMYNLDALTLALKQAGFQTNINCRLFLQVEWEKREKMMPLIVEYIKEHPRWRVSIQTHKYMNIP